MNKLIAFLCLLLIVISCKKDKVDSSCFNPDFQSQNSDRIFKMGFTSWPYGPNQKDVDNTYKFISEEADIYAEHIDNKIPWQAWINNTELPSEFTNDIEHRVKNKIADLKLLVSISLLNLDRTDLAEDFDGTIPVYTSINDKIIEDAYVKHVEYIISKLDPDYLVIVIECNELKIHDEEKWQSYKLLMTNIKGRIKQSHPNLSTAESITLHNLYQPDVSEPESFINDVVSHMNQSDFIAISYYPFFKLQHSKEEFQKAFDFLHAQTNKPIAFVETCHLAEDLIAPSLNLNITSSPCEQNDYLEVLLENAQNENYKFIIWWAHRDFDALWETFPDQIKDIGQLWRDTGIQDENDDERPAKLTWDLMFN